MLVSVVIGTFNRCGRLAQALESLFAESDSSHPFEVIVVDNGSTDRTAAVIDDMSALGRPVRRLVDTRRGVSFARNAGLAAARAPLLAVMDDDQLAPPGWVATIATTFDEHPELDFLAGPVEPMWSGQPPAWITSGIQGAVSIIDRGGLPRPIDASHWMCVPGGNSAFRKTALESVGGWLPYPRSQDRELTVRLLLGGHRGLYVPAMRMRHHVRAERVSRNYFRWWNATEGRMRAHYRFEELFDPDGRIHPPPDRARSLAGVPLFLYRRLCEEGSGWVRALAARRSGEAFEHELRFRYFWNYIWTRRGQRGASAPH
jgi:glycosyltransferase involved in cell wall biosynthesis